ncbi:MAG: ATP-binding protein [Prosthecobacter sp.]|nr:ATP-binding protein [Prosthecobacter sp.]
MQLLLPRALKSHLFIDFLSSAEEMRDCDLIEVDFKHLMLITPGPLAALTAIVNGWVQQGKTVHFNNLHVCPISGYLQRMDFLKMCGLHLDEKFERRDSKGRFVPVQKVDHPVDKLGDEMAECLAPGGSEHGHAMADLWDFAWYVMTETGNNVRQHSLGTGYATAQVTLADSMVKLAIADNGKGILKTFQDAELEWSFDMSDEEAIVKALQPRVSSKFGPNNEGVGLTLVSNFIQLTGGWLGVLSGTGLASVKKGGSIQSLTLPHGAKYTGTLIAIAVGKENIGEYAKLLIDAKIKAGLLEKNMHRALFE